MACVQRLQLGRLRGARAQRRRSCRHPRGSGIRRRHHVGRSLVPAPRNSEPHKLYLYPTGVGEQRAIDLGDLRAGFGTFENDITFSRDGRWGLLSAFNTKGEVRDYLFDLRSDKLRAVTPAGMQGGKLSPDAAQVVAVDIARQKLVLVDIASG